MALLKQKTTKQYVVKALKAYPQKLDMKEFVAYTNFPINSEIIDSFYTQMHDDIPIYLNDYAIEFFGYSGELKKQKDLILDTLKTPLYAQEKGVSWWIYDKEEYEKFLSGLDDSMKKVYPPLKTGKGSGRATYVLIMPFLYEHLCMSVTTVNGYQIRTHYINMKKLVRAMMAYEAEYEGKTYQEIIRQLSNTKESKKYAQSIKQKMKEMKLQEENREGFVYFIEEDDDAQRIKIGWAWDVKQRLQTLQIGNPKELTIARTIKTKKPWKLEKQLHDEFSKFQVRGEWFTYDVMLEEKYKTKKEKDREEDERETPEEIEERIQMEKKYKENLAAWSKQKEKDDDEFYAEVFRKLDERDLKREKAQENQTEDSNSDSDS